MALVTQTSITRPFGVDARLEGLSGGLPGQRVPDPILEGETREALVSWLETYEAQHPRPPELSPIYQLDPLGQGQRVGARLYFSDRARGFIVDGEALATLESQPGGPRVHVQLGATQREALATLTAALVGHRLALSLDSDALMLPIVIEPVHDGNVQLLTQTSLDPAQTSPALFRRLTVK